jgi:hypothetical protein
MRVQFTYTQEDLVDASTRFLARSKMIRKWRLIELGWTIALTWTIVFLIFRNELLTAVLAASATALITVLLVRLCQPVIIKRKLRKYVKEQHRDENAFPCEVQLTAEAVLIQARGTHTTLNWQTVEEINVTADSVDIFARDGGVIVRDRAFSSPDEKRHFVELAQNYLAAARPDPK